MKRLWTAFAALGLAICAVAYAHAQQIGATDLLRGLADPSRWLTRSGDYAGKRHSPLTQITPENVARLTPLWSFETGLGFGRNAKFEATPIAIDGTLYVTGLLNHAWAIDGRTGALIWHYQRKLPPDTRICCGMVNRGFAVFGDRLFMTTLDAHVMAIDRKTGAPIWDVPMIDYELGYSATAAPLVVKDKLIVGMAGGDLATRGFLDAYSLETGKRLGRFNTVPAPGEPGGDTWPAGHFERGGGATWITGSYDPDLNLLYWGVGNPNPDFYGGNRLGDNLYTASVIALDPDTGRLRWHFQYTPHDEHDWDSNQIQVLADLTIGGRPRKTKYELGDLMIGGSTFDRGGTGALRAIDPVTLERKWEVTYGGPSYSGVLSTASGLVFAGDNGSTLMAVKADTGQTLWSHRLSGAFWGAPSTVMVDTRQLLLMPAGQTLTAFALAPFTSVPTK